MSITRSESPDNLDSSSIDNEHRVQVGLLDALYETVREKQPASKITEILNQLTAYSELHFMSEELLMRMYAYPDYDDHVQDHESMTQYLNDITKTYSTGEDNLVLGTVSEMRQFLLAHISTRDEALSEYLTRVQA